MKHFDIYRQSGPEGSSVEAVKKGFSWPAFFFTGIWALTKRLWGYGVFLILIAVSMNLTNRYAAEEGLTWLWSLTALVALAVSIHVGLAGNDWRRRNLAEAGFVASGTVQAQNAKDALAAAPVENEQIAEGTAQSQDQGEVRAAAALESDESGEAKGAQAPQRRFSIGGLIVSGLLFLSMAGNLSMMLTEGPFLFSLLLTTAVPAVALLIRSFRPPVGFARGLAVVFGGMMLGMSTVGIEMGLLTSNYDGGRLIADLIFVVLGVLLLWLGFKPVKAKAK